MTLTKTQIYLRSIVFFFICLIRSGTLVVIPQLFLINNYSQNKNSLLAFILILGTITAILGLRRSSKVKEFKRPKTVISLSIVIITLSLFPLFLVKNLVAYFLVFCFLRYTVNFTYNYVDQYFVRTTPDKLLKAQVNANVKYQLFGIMISPFYFPFVSDLLFINIGILVGLGLLSAWFATRKSNKIDSSNLSQKRKSEEETKFTTKDWLFIIYAGSVISGVTVLSSIIIYVLKDYYLFSDPKTFGGILIGLISIVAIGTVQIHSILKKPIIVSDTVELEFRMFSPYLTFIALGLFLIVTILLGLKLSTSFEYLIFLSYAAGCANGLFLSITRQYAGRISVVSCKPKLLSMYNNLTNYAALVGFSILLPVSLVSAKTDLNFCFTMIHVITGFFFIAICFSILYLFKSAPVKGG